jgi:uncharacterized protein (DUF2235 family)
MKKTIVFCADGTWNGPDKDENEDRQPDPTNVFKLFCSLRGALSVGSIMEADEQEKELQENGNVVQVAKYIHGVGDSKSPIIKLMGGAFGAGMIARIVRGYTFVSRNCNPGDSIVIVGFSRGAYTARALSGLIASEGLLSKNLANVGDKEKAYRAGAKAWYRYREHANTGFLQKFVEVLADLPAFVTRDDLKDSDLVPVDSITAVGVWDTVGALGLPHYIREPGVDAFKYTNTKLNPKIKYGFHAISLDEQRDDFTPCLWEPRQDLLQMVFPGAHADVGGGYPMIENQSGLSDIALGWMVDQLKGPNVGVQFETNIFPGFAPDALGTAHEPWLKFPFNDPGRCHKRALSKNVVQGDQSIEKRKGQLVKDDPSLQPSAYNPSNWP